MLLIFSFVFCCLKKAPMSSEPSSPFILLYQYKNVVSLSLNDSSLDFIHFFRLAFRQQSDTALCQTLDDRGVVFHYLEQSAGSWQLNECRLAFVKGRVGFDNFNVHSSSISSQQVSSHPFQLLLLLCRPARRLAREDSRHRR